MLSILQALGAAFVPRNFIETEKRGVVWDFVVPGKDSQVIPLVNYSFLGLLGLFI